MFYFFHCSYVSMCVKDNACATAKFVSVCQRECASTYLHVDVDTAKFLTRPANKCAS